MNFKHAKGFSAKWEAIFGKPDDLDPRHRLVLERKFLNVRQQRKPSTSQVHTSQTNHIFTCLLFIVTLFEHYLSGMQLFLMAVFFLISLVNSGAILDQRRWIFYLEMRGYWK